MDSLWHPKKQRSKRVHETKKQKKKVEDRISELPDYLLIQILSILPMKDAFKTCILSKRWQYLWPSIDHFSICCKDKLQRRNFVSFVDYALDHSTCSNLKKFHLDFTHLSDYESQPKCVENKLLFPIYRWLATAVEKNVENVVLRSDSYEDDTIYLPHSIYKCSSLITLDLSCCDFHKEFIIDWKSLKSLKLKYMTLDDDDIVNLLSGCPALETLEFFKFYGFGRLEINSSNLKRLKIEEIWSPVYFGDNSLEIFAPHIQHLEISEDLYDLKCRLVNVSSVVSAKLTFKMSCTFSAQGISSDTCPDEHQVIRTLVADYLQKLSNATELTIGTWFTEVLMQFEELTVPKLKCKCLTLDLHITQFYFYGAAILVRASPHVETLNITMATTLLDPHRCAFELKYLDEGREIPFLSSFGFPNLKNVKVVSSSGMCLKERLQWNYVWDYDDLFKLSEYVLKNATVLEKFVIILRRRKCKSCSMDCVSQYSYRLAEKLAGRPRSSTSCVIICQEGAFHY